MDHPLIGKSITLEDQHTMTVIQAKVRDENKVFITYHIQQGNSIPRKLIMELTEFEGKYGELFK
jgi:hypothetical protein